MTIEEALTFFYFNKKVEKVKVAIKVSAVA